MPAVSAPPRVTYTDSHTRASRRLGSQAVADQLTEVVAEAIKWNRPDAPAGWKRLGSGATRMAFLGPDGCAYKVGYGGYELVNRTEVAYWALGLAHREWRPFIPHHRLIEVKVKVEGRTKAVEVLAMEPLEIRRDMCNDTNPGVRAIKKMGAHIGCLDLHGGNFGWRGDHPVLLDAGGGTAGYVGDTSGCETCNPRYYKRSKA